MGIKTIEINNENYEIKLKLKEIYLITNKYDDCLKVELDNEKDEAISLLFESISKIMLDKNVDYELEVIQNLKRKINSWDYTNINNWLKVIDTPENETKIKQIKEIIALIKTLPLIQKSK